MYAHPSLFVSIFPRLIIIEHLRLEISVNREKMNIYQSPLLPVLSQVYLGCCGIWALVVTYCAPSWKSSCSYDSYLVAPEVKDDRRLDLLLGQGACNRMLTWQLLIYPWAWACQLAHPRALICKMTYFHQIFCLPDYFPKGNTTLTKKYELSLVKQI